MFLAFKLADIVQVPFGYLLDWLYQLTTNYGVALILFAIVLKLILLPTSVKSKKSMMKMSRITPRVEALKTKYEKDPQKQQEAIQALYKEEGVGMGGGCLWSFLPLLILIPLYTVVRQPITYILHETADVAAQIVETVKAGVPAAFSQNNYYDEMVAAPLIPQFVEQLKNIVSPKVIDGVAIAGETWKIGGSLVPVIVSLTCVFGIIMAGKLPKHYTEEIVAGEMQAIENRRKK